jgi:hypothetical protein
MTTKPKRPAKPKLIRGWCVVSLDGKPTDPFEEIVLYLNEDDADSNAEGQMNESIKEFELRPVTKHRKGKRK